MADPCDAADSTIEQTIAMQIAIARRPRSPLAPVAGADCLNGCGDQAISGSLYCCAECRDDADRRARLMKLKGRE